MRLQRKIALISITLSLLIAACEFCPIGYSAPEDATNQGILEARAKLEEAFNATVFAEMIGTDVSQAVKNMNIALDYIHQAETLIAQGSLGQAASATEASIQLSEVTTTKIKEMQVQQGLFNFYVKLVLPIIVAAVLVFAGAYAGIFYGRRMWKRRQEKKNIETKTVTSTKAADSNQETEEEKMIIVAVLAAIIVVAGLLIIVTLTPAPQERFVSLYILNSNKNANSYPELMILGENNTYTYYIGVENFMSRIEYCVVRVNIANSSQIAENTFAFEKILLNGEQWEIPWTLTLNKTGVYKVTCTLELYDEMNAVFRGQGLVSLPALQVVAQP